MTETKNSGQPKNDTNNAAAMNVQADDATSTETLSDIEQKEVVTQANSSSTQDKDNRSTSGATPDGQFDGASDEGTRGRDDGGLM